MNTLVIEYKENTVTEAAVQLHLEACAGNFVPPLTDRIDLEAYSKKIAALAATFEAWQGNKLIGLIAAYANSDTGTAFITNVSVNREWMKAGVASALLNRCLAFAKEARLKQVELEVNKDNQRAVAFYKKFDFTSFRSSEESLFMKLPLQEDNRIIQENKTITYGSK